MGTDKSQVKMVYGYMCRSLLK